jgi:hypothetical protein
VPNITSLRRAVALVERLEKAAERAPLTVRGSQGMAAHPVHRSLAEARKAVRLLRRQLGLEAPATQREMRDTSGWLLSRC